MIEFFTEIYSEEIPARFQENAAIQLGELFTKHSQAAGLEFDNLATFVSPMRLSLKADVAKEIPAQEVEKRGPRVGAPEQAILGFCSSAGIAKEHLTEKDGYYFAYTQIPAKSAAELLPDILRKIITDFAWVKTMRWPQAELPWVRPVRSVLAILEGKTLSFDMPEFGLKTVGYTYGHRFLAPQKIDATTFNEYKEKLKCAHVLVDHVERKAAIESALTKAAQEKGLELIPDTRLLNEVTGLVEHPGVFIGRLDQNLFAAPEVAITTSMRHHQKCFAFRGKDGKLAPYFAAVINTIPKDGGKALTQGYEMGMLKARLEDARFFYELDLKTPLQDYLPKLDKIVYHEKLGTLGEKVQRHIAVAKVYAENFSLDQDKVERASKLAKCDLLTQMVGEFDELQGIMGEIYARAQGESEDIAKAISDHYKPAGQNDAVPTAALSIVTALIDKIDTLTGFIGVGILPTGSKDPFALRRAALGVIRIVLENKIDANLYNLVKASFAAYLSTSAKLSGHTDLDVLNFIRARLSFALRDQGYAHDVIAACIGKDNEPNLNILNIQQRAEALAKLLGSETGQTLLAGYKRAANILAAERKKDNREALYPLDELKFKVEQERQLYNAVKDVRANLRPGDPKMFDLLASLKGPIDAFFNYVMVNDTDAAIRLNRLALLEETVTLFEKIADYSKLEG